MNCRLCDKPATKISKAVAWWGVDFTLSCFKHAESWVAWHDINSATGQEWLAELVQKELTEPDDGLPF